MHTRTRANAKMFNSTKPGDALGDQRETERWLQPPFRILIVSKRQDAADSPIMRGLAANPEIVPALAATSIACTQLDPQPYDVILVDLSNVDLEPLSWALQVRAALGHPELVFMTYDATDPVSSGLQELGLEYVVPGDEAARWVSENVIALATMARAKRAFDDAKAHVAHAAERLTGKGADMAPTFGLFEAEQRFRETYVRALLGRASSRQEAASLARLSYRTLCHILSKLGLSSTSQLSD